ncbi:MAG: proton-conducting transporter membrane subunit [Armatimonadota bacterium]
MLDFPWLVAALGMLAVGSIVALRQKASDGARRVGLIALATHLVLLLIERRGDTMNGFPVGRGWVGLDAVNAIPLPVVGMLGLAVLAFAPRRALGAAFPARLLWFVLATDIAYAATGPWVMAAAWALAWLPMARDLDLGARALLCAASVLLPAGIALGPKGLFLVLAAVVLRKGLFPAQGWIVRNCARGALLPMLLLVNAHAGAFVLLRLAPRATPLVTDLALGTAVYAAVVGLRDRALRRILAWLSVSQSAFLVAGLESGTVEGLSGAMLLWQVVVASTAVLFLELSALEARIDGELSSDHLGLAARAPRLAAAFGIAGLALVGAPATLGFCAEDLLLHGTLAAHPRIGILLPIATAMNAVTVVRLFARLFLGPTAAGTEDLEDALPRERAVLTAVILFLMAGGLAPRWLAQRSEAAARAVLPEAAGAEAHDSPTG